MSVFIQSTLSPFFIVFEIGIYGLSLSSPLISTLFVVFKEDIEDDDEKDRNVPGIVLLVEEELVSLASSADPFVAVVAFTEEFVWALSLIHI